MAMISEKDIEALEQYLDGALDPAEVEALKTRLSEDAGLANQLKRLHGDRMLRQRVWQACEADCFDSQAILSKVTQKTERRAWFQLIHDYRQRIATVAACIGVFLIGWQWGQHAETSRVISDGVPAANPVRLITQQAVPIGQTMQFEVRVADAAGNVIRTQRFATFHEAEQYVRQLQQELLKKP